MEKNYSSNKIKRFSPEIYSQLLTEGIIHMNAEQKWIAVHDYLNNLQKNESNNVGEMLLNFYRDNAFNDRGLRFGDDRRELPNKQNELLKLHFFKSFSHLTRSLNVTDHLWSSFKEYQTDEF